MSRYVLVLLLICCILNGCAKKNDNNPPNGSESETTIASESETTIVSETVLDESQTDSALENNEFILDIPFEVDKTLNGVAFKLGEENSVTEQSVLKIKGSGNKSLYGNFSFEGVLEIDGKDFDLSFENDEVNLLSYSSPIENKKILGTIFIDSDFTAISICVIEDSWSNKDGSMYSYPGETKAEGLEVANLVMEEYISDLRIPKLK